MDRAEVASMTDDMLANMLDIYANEFDDKTRLVARIIREAARRLREER